MCNWSYCPDKGNLNTTPCASYGLSQPICEKAFARLRGELNSVVYGKYKPFQDDYTRIYTIMSDPDLIMSCLTTLNHTILTQASGPQVDVNWVRLSSILSYFERKCWFSEDILLPMGILSANDFFFYIRRGYMLKDYGAGVQHGEFTHRLQWHVVMRVITNDFTVPIRTGWNHSPLQIYISLGESKSSTWAKLFDQAVGSTSSFSSPAAFHTWVLQNSQAFPKLVGLASKRETKRRKEFVEKINAYVQWMNQGSSNITVPSEYFGTSDPLTSHENFKKFDDWFQQVLKQKSEDVGKVYGEFQDSFVNKYLPKKTANVDTLETKPKWRKTPYVKCAQGAVYKLGDNAILTEEEADKRAQTSTGALQT